MRAGQIYEIVLVLALVLPLAGCAQVHQAAKSENLQVSTLATPEAQSAQPLKPHLVRGRFEPGSDDGKLTFIFDVSPIPESLPTVRWVRSLGDDPKTVAVQSEKDGRYNVVLDNVQKLDDGQVLIELSNAVAGSFETHGAEFALLEHVTDRSASRPSRNGHFQVFTRPGGLSPASRLLIGSSEQPIENLPAGVKDSAVAGVYTLDLLPLANPDGWLLTMAVASTDAKPTIFYLPKGETVWRVLKTTAIEDHPLLGASVPGPGTYLLVREVTR